MRKANEREQDTLRIKILIRTTPPTCPKTAGRRSSRKQPFAVAGHPSPRPKVSTTIRLSQDVIDHFKADGRGWQTRIDEALREWIRKYDTR